MAIRHVEYLELITTGAAQRFAARVDRYTRSHLPVNLDQITAKRGESPFIDAVVDGFARGIKVEPMADEADWAAAASGLEPYGGPDPNAPYSQLRIGKSLAEAYSAAGAGELQPLTSDHGYAFAGEQGSDVVLASPDGTTWTATSTGSGSTAGVAALLARHVQGPPGGDGPYRRAWASFWDNEKVYRSDDHGATWELELDFEDGTGDLPGSGSGTVLGVAEAITQLYTFPGMGRAYAVAENFGDDYGLAAIGIAASSSDPSLLITGWLEEPYCRAGVMVGDSMWLAGADVSDPLFCSLYTVNPGVALGDPQKVTRLQGNYFTGATLHAGDTYWGGAVRGELYRCDGTALELFHTFPTAQPIRGLCSLRGFLYVSIYNDSLARLEAWRWDGTAWSQPHYAAATLTEAGQMVEFDGRLFVAAGNATTRKVYAVSETDNHTTARVVLPDAAYGAPADPKRFRRVLLQHSALLAGQGVEALYSLDGGSYVSLGTDWSVGSTRTAFELPDSLLGGRLSAWFSITNGAAQAMTLYGGKVSALPAPDSREVWEVELILEPQASGAWSDAAADTPDAISKYDALAALRGVVLQAVDPFRDASDLPRRAMRATIDLQVPFGATFGARKVAGAGAGIPLRLLQAASPENLITNGSFERDTAGSHPTGWALSGAVTDWVTTAVVGAPHGDRVLWIAYDGVAATPSVYQAVTVIPGRWYTLSGSIRRLALTGASAALYLRVSEAGTPIAGAATTHLAAGSDAGFVRYGVTFRVPTSSGGTVAVEVYASGTPGGGLYADAIQLEEGAPVQPFRERGA